MDGAERVEPRPGERQQDVADWKAIPSRLRVLFLHAKKANRLKRNPCTAEVYFCGNSSVVERDLAKVDVAGPTPVSRCYSPYSEKILLYGFFLQTGIQCGSRNGALLY